MTRQQCVAARALLDWSQTDLALAAGVGVSTIRDYERSARTPREDSASKLVQAFRDANIVFPAGGVIHGTGQGK